MPTGKQNKLRDVFYCQSTLPIQTAFKALARGEADKDQQSRILEWLIHMAARTYDQSYRGVGSETDTAFAEGRRFVGLQIIKQININPAVYKRDNKESELG